MFNIPSFVPSSFFLFLPLQTDNAPPFSRLSVPWATVNMAYYGSTARTTALSCLTPPCSLSVSSAALWLYPWAITHSSTTTKVTTEQVSKLLGALLLTDDTYVWPSVCTPCDVAALPLRTPQTPSLFIVCHADLQPSLMSPPSAIMPVRK